MTYDWLINQQTGAVDHDEIARRAQIEAQAIITQAEELAAANPLDRWARKRAAHGIEHFVTHLIEGWTASAELRAWAWRVERGDLSDAITLDDAQIKGLSSDRWAS